MSKSFCVRILDNLPTITNGWHPWSVDNRWMKGHIIAEKAAQVSETPRLLWQWCDSIVTVVWRTCSSKGWWCCVESGAGCTTEAPLTRLAAAATPPTPTPTPALPAPTPTPPTAPTPPAYCDHTYMYHHSYTVSYTISVQIVSFLELIT